MPAELELEAVMLEGNAAPRQLVIYVFSNTDPEYYGNLVFFLKHGLPGCSTCDYIIVINAGDNEEVCGAPLARALARPQCTPEAPEANPLAPPARCRESIPAHSSDLHLIAALPGDTRCVTPDLQQHAGGGASRTTIQRQVYTPSE